jgi:hypothetical protein
MSQKLKHQDPSTTAVAAITSRCKADGCKAGSQKMDFCEEHFTWFKFGLVDKHGHRPIDFDKKYAAFVKHHKVA